jgi:hypothetical protein
MQKIAKIHCKNDIIPFNNFKNKTITKLKKFVNYSQQNKFYSMLTVNYSYKLNFWKK